VIVAALLVGGVWWGWSRLWPSAVSRGIWAYRRGDWDAAYQLARERLQTVNKDTEAQRLLARSTARLGRHPEAHSIYAGLGTGLLEAEDYYLIALGNSLAGRSVEGRQLLWMGLASDPDHVESLDLYARLALETGQVSEAARAAGRLSTMPGREARGDLLLGVIRATDQDPAGAVGALQRALRRDPDIRIVSADRFGATRLLGREFLRLGRSGEARDALLRIRDAGPDREASWLLSRACLLEGKEAEAASALAESGKYRAEQPLEPEPSPYVGEARCAGCHSEIQKTVLASRHAQTLRRGRELADLPLPDQPLPDPSDPGVRHLLKRNEKGVAAETRVEDRILRAVVAYALGSSDRYTSLIGADADGRYRTLRFSYHRGSAGQGWDLTKAQEGRPARVEDYLGAPFGSEAEAHECLICHTTNARAFRDRTGPESLDRGIGCERCHGPGGLHLTAVGAGFPDSAIAAPAKTPAAAIGQLCGDCHSQHFLAMPASRTAPDWTRFPGSTLPWSRCYAESVGELSCVTCHDPHRNAETAPAYYEAKCLSCHATARADAGASRNGGAIGARTRSTCPVSPSRDCLGCHMPKVRYGWLHGDFTDHYIRVHPREAAGVQRPPARGSTTAPSPSRSSQG